MMAKTSRLMVAGVLLVVAALVAGLILVLRPFADDRTHLTVDFDRTVSLYEGADVRILGVPVGQVDSVDPMGEKVRVELSWDADYKVPADAKAVIVSPSIVGDRYVQLTPAYESGPVMEDDTVLDASKTAVPTELDQVYESLDQLATALGPEGANKNGALDRLLSSTADAFDGQGKRFHRTIEDLSKLTGTLDRNKNELFGSVAQLERFVKALADNDAVVREFNASLSEVSRMLAGERRDLSGALRALGSSLDEIRTYVRDNRNALESNVNALVDVTDQLVDQRKNLAKILDTAPTALANQVLAYNPSVGAFDNRSTVVTPLSLRLGSDFELLQVTPTNASTWTAARMAWCSLQSHRGITGGLTPEVSKCLTVATQDFMGELLTQGMGHATPATVPEPELNTLKRRPQVQGLARMMAKEVR